MNRGLHATDMCGIAGFVCREGKPAELDVLKAMTATLSRRGPDGDGFYIDGSAGLGHRRLSIIDLAGGSQPMSNEDGSVWVTYNGEIYNEPALRAALESRGHVFRTQSDTECLVHLYEEHGPEFARELNGMFALAIWDARRRRLVLARDRMGQKPLLYAVTTTGALVFGSEPKALLEHPDVARRIDPAGLARYLFYEYLPAPHSIWSGMRKLPPAHVLVWEDGGARVDPYWRPSLPNGESAPLEEAAPRFWDEFRQAVGRHRRSDVPLGVFLSGGIDSSSVAAALSELEPARGIRTFSIAFDDRSFDESSHARAVAEYLGTDHREKTFAVESVRELLPEVVEWLDEPFGDASLL
ncbi:asparagine synthase (glutamine-hydrolyzing), partial [Singulisphaera rosea]